jgi:hypothetical protein
MTVWFPSFGIFNFSKSTSPNGVHHIWSRDQSQSKITNSSGTNAVYCLKQSHDASGFIRTGIFNFSKSACKAIVSYVVQDMSIRKSSRRAWYILSQTVHDASGFIQNWHIQLFQNQRHQTVFIIFSWDPSRSKCDFFSDRKTIYLSQTWSVRHGFHPEQAYSTFKINDT